MGTYLYEVILTPGEDGGFDVSVPCLPGCFTYGDSRMEAISQAADAMKTYVASLLHHGEAVPASTPVQAPSGSESVAVFFETDDTYVVPGERMSAAEASRVLGVSPGRVTHMIESGVLDGYREGRRTWVTKESVERRLADSPRPGRPRKDALQA